MTTDRARQLRQNPTGPERRLWSILRPFRDAYHFPPAGQIGPYYADIASFHANLVIEADGVTHTTDDDQAYDRRRDAYLRSRGFRILRLWNDDILGNPDGVHQLVAQALTNVPELTPTPVPSPQGGGRRKSRQALADLATRTGDNS